MTASSAQVDGFKATENTVLHQGQIDQGFLGTDHQHVIGACAALDFEVIAVKEHTVTARTCINDVSTSATLNLVRSSTTDQGIAATCTYQVFKIQQRVCAIALRCAPCNGDIARVVVKGGANGPAA